MEDGRRLFRCRGRQVRETAGGGVRPLAQQVLGGGRVQVPQHADEAPLAQHRRVVIGEPVDQFRQPPAFFGGGITAQRFSKCGWVPCPS